MALEEKEKITTKAIMEAEEEVKVTPPARRKKAERMKNKSSGNLPQLTCDNETIGTSAHAGDVTDGSSLTAAKVNENDVKLSKPELSSQVDAMNSGELHDTRNGMPENSCAGETTDRNGGSFGNDLENSSVKATESVAFQNESKTTSSCKENDEKAATLNVLSDIKEETEERSETCISSSITSGQDEESFFSAEEAETSASEVISSTLPNLTEVVKENSAELESQEVVSSVNSETRNTNEKAVANLEQDGQDLSKAQDSDSSGCLNESLQILTSKNIDETRENSHILSKIGDKDLPNAEISLIDRRTAKSSETSKIVQVDLPSSELLGDELGAVGGAVDTDSEDWSSSSDTSSEGEYNVGYFEIFRGLQEENSQNDSKDGLKEILSAFPSGTELVNVTTDSEDNSNRGDTPRNFKTQESALDSSLIDDDDSDEGIKMLACFSPAEECPVVMDDITSEPEKAAANSARQSEENDDTCYNNTTATTLESSTCEINSDVGDKNTSGALETPDGISSLESSDVDSLPSAEENNVLVKKRSGSFKLIKKNGSLKIVDTSETPVTTEDVKKAKLVKTPSLMGETNSSSGELASDSADAKEVLQDTISEAKSFNEEFKNVCDGIATLEKLVDSENEANVDDMGEDSVDAGAVVISIDASKQNVPILNLEGRTTSELPTDEVGDSVMEGDIKEGIDDIDTASASNKRKQPTKILLGKRYSLDNDTALLSPEDNIVELRNFRDNGSFKIRPSPVSAETEALTSTAEGTDGQEDIIATPLPPPRTTAGRLVYSGSFSPGATKSVIHRAHGKPLSKRSRSERRSKTLPNNVFDMFGSAFKTSNSAPEHIGPITLITDNLPATFPGFPVDRRAQVALELYTTERSYVRGLETILQLFKKPIEENKLLEKKEITTMFLNIQDIYLINKDLLFMLLERINHWHDQQCMGDIFLDQSFKIIDRMKIYAKYCNNYDSAETLYKQKIKKKEFEAFVNSCYEHAVCQPGLNLPAYLIKVVQRIPRYLLLLENLLKRTPENHPDHGNLSKALVKMDNLAVYINNQLQTVVGLKAMEELRSRVMGLKAFEVPGRALIKEADVVVNGNKKTYKCLLFNDILVFGIKGVSRTNEFQILELATLWCMDLEGNNPQSAKEDSLEIYTPESSYIMYAGTKNEKKVWLQKLRTTIAMVLHGVEATEKDEIESRKAKFTYRDGRDFCGNFVSGKRHGEGTLSWPNQARYQGYWEDDDRCGRGELMYNGGDKYKGEWLDDKQHGIGTVEFVHGDVYRGEWYQGDMHGKGAIAFKNGDRFEGDFHHNEIQGIGELRCVSGLMYRGDWRHSKKHGKGKMHFPSGDVYIGEFANDRISGQGEMQYADGSIYKGQWIDNQRGGHGEFSSPDRTHYVGGWSKDHINGKGCMKYSNGDCYDGNWFKNTRFGQGVMKYSNGDVYEGGFEYDLCSKSGRMTYKDGSVYEGNWLNNLRHGKGKMVYANKKSVFEGDWMYGMRHGEGVLTFANRASYSGHWELDKQNGRGMYTDTSVFYHYEGEWKNGLKHGKGVEETREGKYEGEWKDDMRHGQGMEISSGGTEFDGRWKENRKHGKGTKKLKTGMVEEQLWHEGKQVDVTSIVVTELPLIQRR